MYDPAIAIWKYPSDKEFQYHEVNGEGSAYSIY